MNKNVKRRFDISFDMKYYCKKKCFQFFKTILSNIYLNGILF